MQPEIQMMLSMANDVDQVGTVLNSACAAFGTVVKTRVLYTRQQEPPRTIMGVVQLEEQVADKAAKVLGADCFGERLVVFRYEAPEDFEVLDDGLDVRAREAALTS